MADFSFKFSVDGAQLSALSLAFQGRLREEIQRNQDAIAAAYPKAMKTGVVEPGKRALRGTIEASGFYRAAAFAKVWRASTYPANASSLEPAGVFKTRAAVIIDAFEDGVTIRATDAKYLAVPEGPAKAIVHRLNQSLKRGDSVAGNRQRSGGKFVAQDNIVARVSAALGVDLVPIIDKKTDRGVLVAKENAAITKGGRFAKRQTGRQTPLFALVRQSTLKRRPMGRDVLADISAGAEARFVAALASSLNAENRE